MDPSYVNTTFLNDSQSSQDFSTAYHVTTWIIISIGLPLTLLAICALYSLVQDDQVAPVYVINLLVSDLIQICCLVIRETTGHEDVFGFSIFFYIVGLIASVGFMVLVALERYLVIAWPLWYRFRRNIKTSLMISFLVWVISVVLLVLSFIVIDSEPDISTVFAIVLLLPFPLLIFFLVGTLRALSGAISVPAEEKRRIVGVLLLVLLNYTLLFLPTIIWFLAETGDSKLCLIIVQFSPLVDLVLYVFMRKGAVDTLLAYLCPCRLTREQHQTSTTNENTTEIVSTV